ncbi:single Ig IL-1-related receptor [Esox lucius]|uniref:single Ig IL-1-related receptor n=1 Tax=Esox lucius TaxID=8010 RepID=UPI001476FA53|nr:single Ig IL-1-related receptor [Esox lucius]
MEIKHTKHPVLFVESLCRQAPQFQRPDGGQSEVWETLGSSVSLNCTALLSWDPADPECGRTSTFLWSKDGTSLNLSLYVQNSSAWISSPSQRVVSSVLQVQLGEPADFGLYSCEVRNISTYYSLHNTTHPSHTAAVIGAISLLLVLTTAAIVYSRCTLNMKLWYRNSYGDYEGNDGKLHDAYISYVNNEYDRKFVHFILKPHLENKSGHKLHLNDCDILPGAEPSAELLMNVSRCRRLIVVMSHAYLEQDWCCNNFRQGLLHLLELSQMPVIVITLEGQVKHMRPDVVHQLREQQHRLTLLTWSGSHSIPPSSAFWKRLSLAMPRGVLLHRLSGGDPQTLLQDDEDPILTLNPDYLDCRPDPDPAGDLGVRVPRYKALTSKAPVLPVFPSPPPPLTEPKPSDIDVSDLGSRNYGPRNDFYCLVSEEDM